MKQLLSAPNLLALAFASLGALAAFSAAEAGQRDVAKIYLPANGADQRIDVDLQALQPGQSRQLFTDSGLPAVVSRSAEGLSIELAGETHEVRMPQVVHFLPGDAAASGETRMVVIKRRDEAEGGGEATQEVRVARLDGSNWSGAVDFDTLDVDALVAQALADAEAAGIELPEHAGEGRKQRVIRLIERPRAD